MWNHARTLLVLALAAGPLLAQELAPEPAVPFDRRAAEHLLNRAGFGATAAEVDAAVAAGLEATIDALFLPADAELEAGDPERLTRKDGREMAAYDDLRANGGREAAPPEMVEAAQQAGRMMRRADRRQLQDYTVWWFDAMASGADPLRDRMTLFWHGYFTSSQQDVKSSYQMIEQNQLLRANALGSFRELLHGVAKDPAMLEYLDNDENQKRKPNENFAREVMELFTLGEGHYTEEDIKEAARAFTGWRARRSEFVASDRQHDGGTKTVLGVTGKLDGEDVLDILLDQPACASYVAGRVLTHLEGAAPDPVRLARYAGLLRSGDYQLEPLLRALFADPDFYRDAVVGQRVAGPVDLLVGMSRRLGVTPPEVWYTAGSELLGQHLFHPPNVKGWDEGMAWITTASLMQRGNLAGILVGTVDADEVLSDTDEMFTGAEDMDDMGAMTDMQGEPMEAAAPVKGLRFGALSGLKAMSGRWNPNLNLAGSLRRAGATTPGQAVDHLADALLAVELGPGTRAMLVDELERLRAEAAAAPSDRSGRFRLRARRADEGALRSLVHLMLSLPEAQLH